MNGIVPLPNDKSIYFRDNKGVLTVEFANGKIYVMTEIIKE